MINGIYEWHKRWEDYIWNKLSGTAVISGFHSVFSNTRNKSTQMKFPITAKEILLTIQTLVTGNHCQTRQLCHKQSGFSQNCISTGFKQWNYLINIQTVSECGSLSRCELINTS